MPPSSAPARSLPPPVEATRTLPRLVLIDDGLLLGSDGHPRCWWGVSDPLYEPYHDEEWGHPVADDARLFEKLSLEGFQAGLSWLTILRKRESFRAGFAGFQLDRVADYGPADVERLMEDASIVRHRGKIEATINNAQRALDLQQEFGSLAAYVWGFEPSPETRPPHLTKSVLFGMAETPNSRAMSIDLKRRGWRFVGPTTVYAFMQAMGLVNDHLEECIVRAAVEHARHEFTRPQPVAGGA